MKKQLAVLMHSIAGQVSISLTTFLSQVQKVLPFLESKKMFEKRSSFLEHSPEKLLVKLVPGQKVVSYAYYGKINSDSNQKRGYFEGISQNLKLLPVHYPDWVMRIYVELDKSDSMFKDICELACNDTNLDICEARNLPGNPIKDATKLFARNWRFFPSLDPQVRKSLNV